MRIDFNSALVHGVSELLTAAGIGGRFIGFKGANFFPFWIGRGGGGITNRRSSIIGATTGALTVETETVWEFSSTLKVVFDGDALPGAFLTGILFMALFLAGAVFAIVFFTGAFFTGSFFAAIFLAGAFFVGAFFAGAFFATAFFSGFFCMGRTLFRLGRGYQLRHGQVLIQQWPRLCLLTI